MCGENGIEPTAEEMLRDMREERDKIESKYNIAILNEDVWEIQLEERLDKLLPEMTAYLESLQVVQIVNCADLGHLMALYTSYHSGHNEQGQKLYRKAHELVTDLAKFASYMGQRTRKENARAIRDYENNKYLRGKDLDEFEPFTIE